MKKILSAALAFEFTLCLAACGNTQSGTANTGDAVVSGEEKALILYFTYIENIGDIRSMEVDAI